MTDTTSSPVSDLHAAFRAAIDAAPQDTTPRLIYADWLAEQGDEAGSIEQRTTVARLERELRFVPLAASAAKRLTALRGLALTLGERYHAGVQDLHASKRASVRYGRGGQEDLDWDAYGRSGKNYAPNGRGIPAKWRDSGARLDSEQRPTAVILESHRGTEVVRLPLPPRRKLTFAGLLRSDLYGQVRHLCGLEIVTRYGWTPRRGKVAGHYHQTGYAVAVPASELLAAYWEHGVTLAAIRREIGHKAEIARAERDAAALDARLTRAAARIAQRWPQLVCTVADARAVGYCVAGIEGFAARCGLTGRTEAMARDLRATGDAQVEKVIQAAALRTAAALFARRPAKAS